MGVVRTSQHPSTTMVTLLGRNLPDRKLVKIAIRQFVGVGETVSRQIMARLQLHDQLKVGDLSETQLNSLGTILSTPQAAPRSPVRVFGSLSNDAKLVESPAPNPADGMRWACRSEGNARKRTDRRRGTPTGSSAAKLPLLQQDRRAQAPACSTHSSGCTRQGHRCSKGHESCRRPID